MCSILPRWYGYFYRRSSFSGNINEYYKTYQKIAEGRLRTSAREMVSDLLHYLNTKPVLYVAEKTKVTAQKAGNRSTGIKATEIRERERHFYIVPELLAPVGNISFVNIKDDHHVSLPAELPPGKDLKVSDIRRGFLQFVIDPLVNAGSKDIETIRPAVRKLWITEKVDPMTLLDVYLNFRCSGWSRPSMRNRPRM